MTQKFEFNKTEIEGLYEILSFNNDDARGSFTKDYSETIFLQNGIDYKVKEVFYSTSSKGVLRGMHFQRVKMQPKLVRCLTGHIYDVVVDLRKDSPTFKKWLAFDLTAEKKNEVLVPVGCAHGFLAIEDSLVSYKCGEVFYGEYDDGIMWNDPDIDIKWPIEKIGGVEKLVFSDRDKLHPSFKEFMEKHGGF